MKNKLSCMTLSMLFFFPSLMSISQPIISSSIEESHRILKANNVSSDGFDNRSISEDFEDTGLKIEDYKVDSNSKDIPSFINFVEWGMTATDQPADSYALYLYLYNPKGTTYAVNNSVLLATGEKGADPFSVSYHTYSMTLVDHTDDWGILKFKIRSDFIFQNVVHNTERHYLLGSITLKYKNPVDGKTDKSYPLGKDIYFTGFPKYVNGGYPASTLQGNISDTNCIRVETNPFVSKFGDVMLQSTNKNILSSIDLFSVMFSFPTDFDKYGILQSVHCEYNKYRSTWMLTCSLKSDYEQYARNVGKKFLDSNGNWIDGTPNLGSYFDALFDTDDLPSINPGSYYDNGNHPGYRRFLFNGSDGKHHELRTDMPYWLFYNPGLDDTSDTLTLMQSDMLLKYAKDYPYNLTPAVNTTSFAYLKDPNFKTDYYYTRLNNKVSKDLFYIPNYSKTYAKDYKGFKVGSYSLVENNISRDDAFKSFQSLFSTTIPDYNFTGFSFPSWTHFLPLGSAGIVFSSFVWIYNIFQGETLGFYDKNGNLTNLNTNDNIGEKFMEYYQKRNPEEYNLIFNNPNASQSKMNSLLQQLDISNYKSDPAYKRASNYQGSLDTFVNDHKNENLYRLTYDMAFSNSYRSTDGYGHYYDGTWKDHNKAWSKTDFIYDFQFLDFTFKDENNKLTTIAVSSDPFSISGEPNIPSNKPAEESLNKWLLLIFVSLFIIIGLFVLSFIFPAVKVVVKGILKGLMYVGEATINTCYFVFVWWWLALIKKARGEDTPKLWLFK